MYPHVSVCKIINFNKGRENFVCMCLKKQPEQPNQPCTCDPIWKTRFPPELYINPHNVTCPRDKIDSKFFCIICSEGIPRPKVPDNFYCKECVPVN